MSSTELANSKDFLTLESIVFFGSDGLHGECFNICRIFL